MASHDESSGFNGERRKKDPSPMEHAARAVAEAQAFGRSVSEASSRLQSTLDLNGRVHRSPIASVLVAAGIGYVLGGGLFSPLTKRALKIAMRLAVVPLVKGQLAGLVSGMADQIGEPL
jgi:hypothetical protein